MTKQKGKDPSSLGFMQEFEGGKREDELNLLTTIEKQVQGALSELQYIAEILETNKNVAPVEDLREKIKAAYDKIKAYLNPQSEAEQSMELEANKRTSGGLNVEQNPLIKEMGGLPLEVISPEWRELMEGSVLDKAELENLVNKKLKDKVDLANKLTHKLKLQNKLTNQPKLRAAQQLTPKFKKIQETLKYILKEAPPPPAPAPKIVIPPPRPPGM